MPHEIIMPALGMAQDSGVIVQWLKSPGDAVAEGDALFEVETDKATMEVEAQAAGWLADVRARAGDEVPVGDVIAVIADAPDAAGNACSAEKVPPIDSPSQPDTGVAADLPDGKQVIMPALGMAQDTGLIVAWSKAPGDAVAEDDTLLEVETDKSTMEVPAGASGYVAALLAEAGQEVPVGDVIAVISTDKPAKPMQTRADTKPAALPKPTDTPPKAAAAPASKPTAPQTRTEPARKPAAPARAAPVSAAGRIFASPRARRLAAEAGLDLSRLVAAGYPQPYHAADIETLRHLPAETAASAFAGAARQIKARADAAPSRALLDWMKREEGRELLPAALWLRFAAAALRRARQIEGDLVVELAPIGVAATRYRNPDRAGLAAETETVEDAPDLILRDLSACAITGLSLGTAGAPALNLLADGDGLLVSLDFDAAQLDDDVAISLIAGFADRLDDPLTQLL